MKHKNSNCPILFLLASITVAVYIPNANGATALLMPSAPPKSQHSRHGIQKDVASVVRAMNSIAFLRKLVALKDTSDVRYWQSAEPEPAIAASVFRGGGGFVFRIRKERHHPFRRVPPTVRNGSVHLSAAADRNGIDNESTDKVNCGKSQNEAKDVASNASSESSTAEYTGNLWFLSNKGVRFRETVRIENISRDGKSATVECITKYRRKGQWHECSKVACKLTAVDEGINMETESEVLVSIPLPGLAGKAIRSKILLAFESAAEAFFDVEGGVAETITTGISFYAY